MHSLFSARKKVVVGRLSSAGVALIACALVLAFAAPAFAVTFDPANIISNDNMRACDSMNQADIQAFLNTQKGPLKSLVTTDYAGVKKPAAQIIAEASKKWQISPKVMLCMLQKEQSLLTRTSLLKNTLERAVGAGCPGGPTNKYPGFGAQIYNGARLLDGYGEGKNGSTIPLWPQHKESGKWVKTYAEDIYQTPNVKIDVKNIATYKLYIYNPSIGANKPYGDLSKQSSSLSGNANFWAIYRKYFGDTQANPRIRYVYRIKDKRNGAYIYTQSPAERYNLGSNSRYVIETIAFSYNASNTASNIPVQRFMNRKTRGYIFTASKTLIASLESTAQAVTWRYEGAAFMASGKVKGAIPVYQFNNKKTGLPFLTTNDAEKNAFLTAAWATKKWAYKGLVYYLAQ